MITTTSALRHKIRMAMSTLSAAFANSWSGPEKNSHRSFGRPISNSEVRNADTFGVLKLTLHAASYEWEFVPQAGKTLTHFCRQSCSSSHHGNPLGGKTAIQSSFTAVPGLFLFFLGFRAPP